MNQQKMKAITLNEAVMEAGNPLNEVYMMVRLYGYTTVKELSNAEGFYVAIDDEADQEEPNKEEKTRGYTKNVDHARIVALYTANPPRSIKWIADDMGISEKTVINHLKRDGLYEPGKKVET